MANADFGQSSARWRVLQRISAEETSVAEIAKSTDYSRQAVQQLADALAAEGSARYSADPGDRRKQRLELTEGDAATLEQMEANFDVWPDRLMAHIQDDDLAAGIESPLAHPADTARGYRLHKKEAIKCQPGNYPYHQGQ